MATNADNDDKSNNADGDSDAAIEENLKKVKEDSEVESSEQEADEAQPTDDNQDESDEADGDEEEQSDESENEESEEDEKTPTDEDSEFAKLKKRFPNIKGDTLAEFSANLADSYDNSTTEALRLKREADSKKDVKDTEESTDESDPLRLWARQALNDEINEAFNSFSKDYPQVKDEVEYDKFIKTVEVLSTTILQTEKRLAKPSELYSKTAAVLGWQSEKAKPSDQEKVGEAMKDSAASSKTSSSTKPKTKSKVSDKEILIAREMNPRLAGKSDADIRKELESVK